MIERIKSFYSRKKTKIACLFFLVLSSQLALRGIDWGRVEPWEPDQMVYHYLFYDSDQPFNPFWYLKPPFYTYTAYFLVLYPSELLASNLGLSISEVARLQLIWARLLQLVFLVVSSLLIYKIVTRLNKSSWLGLLVMGLVATSAGLQAHVRTLLVDIPTFFWITTTFFFLTRFALDNKKTDLLLTSFLIGIATSNKYNAILLLPVLSWVLVKNELKKPEDIVIKIRSLFLNFSNVGAFLIFGIILGIPYLIITPSEVIIEIVRVLKITNLHHGGYSFFGYITFFKSLSEVIGYPVVLLLFASIFVCIYSLVKKRFSFSQATLFEASMVFFVINYLYFGYYARLPARFVIPLVPFIFVIISLAAAQFFKRKKSRQIVSGTLIGILCYNLVSCYLLGTRFISNPRMNVQEWFKDNISHGIAVERTANTPNIGLYTGYEIEEIVMPEVDLIFSDQLITALSSSKQLEVAEVELLEKKKEDLSWYSEAALKERKPDFIILDSDGYYYILDNIDHPAKSYMQMLLSNKVDGYTIIWDESPDVPPRWVYPQYFDFLESRVTVLKRTN